MELLTDYGFFLIKLITVITIIIGIFFCVVNITNRKRNIVGKLRITNLNNNFKSLKDQCQIAKFQFNYQKKQWLKDNKKEKKYKEKNIKKQIKQTNIKNIKPTMYIIDFKGDIQAEAISSLREEISAILLVAKINDQVLLRLESQGGLVHCYGLAASQLQRLKDHKLYLIVVIDKIAASGGYMIACVANHIVAAPFAIVGSIGVIAQIPNFNKLLKKHSIDVELHTAGEFKRTLTMFGENNQESRNKFCKKLNETHFLFKQFISQMRPNINIEKVSNGDHWFGKQAIEKNLIDSINTSDEIIMNNIEKFNILKFQYVRNYKIIERLVNGITSLIEKKIFNLWNYIKYHDFF